MKTRRETSTESWIGMVGLTLSVALCACVELESPAGSDLVGYEKMVEETRGQADEQAGGQPGGQPGEVRPHWLPSSRVCQSLAPGVRFGAVDLHFDHEPKTVFCTREIDNKPWVLISSRQSDGGSLFARETCTDPQDDCSGHVPPALDCGADSMEVALATSDRDTWISLQLPPEMHAFLTGERVLAEGNYCHGDHLCGYISRRAQVEKTSGFALRHPKHLRHGWMTSGGMALFDGGGEDAHHGVSFNFAPYGTGDGPLYISGPNGWAVNGAPGALYFHCPDPS